MEPLHTWWATELYPMRERAQFGVSGEFEVVLATDAQATIAALQARVQELEAIKIPDDAFTYCAYCGEKSPVDEHNEDLAAHIKVCPKHPMRDVEAHLTQRTAELEAAKRANTRYGLEIKDLRRTIDEWKAELERVRALVKALPKVEGAVVVSHGYVKDSTRCHALFGADEDAALYAALLQPRQGMEG